MDKAAVALFAASRVEPTVASAGPHSPLIGWYYQTTASHVIFALPLQLNQHFNNSLFALISCLKAHLITYAFLITAFISSKKHIAFHVFVTSQSLLHNAVAMSSSMIIGIWDSNKVQRIRSRLFYEFAVFILGCGNAMILILFWPGWLILGGACYALWHLLS